MATPGIAAGAYARLARLTDPSSALSKAVPGLGQGNEQGPNFGDILKDVGGSVAAAGRKSDSQAVAMATGKANVIDVVTAVAETETAIDALVAVRDKVISAYEEFMRMPI